MYDCLKSFNRYILLNNTFHQIQKKFKYSSNLNTDFFKVEQKENDYVILKLNKSPVNSLNLEKLEKLNKQLDLFENDKQLKGIILTSSVSNVFSAGVDILEMYKCDTERLKNFWINVQDFWLKLYGSKKIYIAALNGHTLAFGCVIAMSCDYRLMVDSDKTKTGLNAVLLGINAPFWFKDTMVNTIGFRESEKALQFGKIFSPKQALEIKLVDELVEKEKLIHRAEELMKQWCKIPTLARSLTKQSLRKDTLNKLLNQRENDLKTFVKTTMDPNLQQNLEKYLNNLKKK